MKIHQCPVCQSSFEGRKNKLYCSTKCKIEYNNAKQAKNMESHRKFLHGFNRNRKILQKIHDVFGDCTLPSYLLSQARLDMNCTNMVRNSPNIQVSDFQLRYINQENYQIIKIKL